MMKNNFHIVSICVFAIGYILCGCSPNQRLYDEYRNSKLSIPYSNFELVCNDSIAVTIEDADYIHIVHIDSVHCTSCLSNKMILWNEYVKGARNLNKNFVLCLIISTNDISSKKHIKRLCQLQKTDIVVYIDSLDQFVSKNEIIKEMWSFKSTLINSKEEVVAFGDPIVNQKIKCLMYDIIKKD